MKKKTFTVLPPSIRNWFVNILDPFVDIVVRLHVHPNHFTILGLIASIIGAIFYAKHDLRIAGLFILLGGICDIIDGKVARKTGLAAPPAASYVGKIEVADIGVPRELIAEIASARPD